MVWPVIRPMTAITNVYLFSTERGHSCPQQLSTGAAVTIRCPAGRKHVAADKNVRAPLNKYSSAQLSFTVAIVFMACEGRRWLSQTQSFRGTTQFLEAPAVFLAGCPIRPLAQPAEMEINSCRFQCGLKTAGRALGPARAFVLGHTLPHEPGPPRPVGQSRQVNLAGGDRRRFPISWINLATAHDDVVLVVFAVTNHLRRGLQGA